MSRCEECVTDKSLCDGCRDNPKYADYPRKSLYREYIPVCPKGYDDCVNDPAYIKHHHSEWYKKLYGDLTPEEVIKTKNSCNDDDCYYDDEDK